MSVRLPSLSVARFLSIAALAAALPVAFALPASASAPGSAKLDNHALVPVRHAAVADRVQHAATVRKQNHPQSSPSAQSSPSGQGGQQTHLMYDSTMPWTLPAHRDVAVYANGHYQAATSQVAGSAQVLWIDVNGSDTSAQVLDVEPGDASPASAARWAKHKLSGSPDTIAVIYTMRAEWQATKDAIGTLPAPLRDRVRWWIADPTGVPHIVPGSQATQWYWGASYDISTVSSDF